MAITSTTSDTVVSNFSAYLVSQGLAPLTETKYMAKLVELILDQLKTDAEFTNVIIDPASIVEPMDITEVVATLQGCSMSGTFI